MVPSMFRVSAFHYIQNSHWHTVFLCIVHKWSWPMRQNYYCLVFKNDLLKLSSGKGRIETQVCKPMIVCLFHYTALNYPYTTLLSFLSLVSYGLRKKTTYKLRIQKRWMILCLTMGKITHSTKICQKKTGPLASHNVWNIFLGCTINLSRIPGQVFSFAK